jgi:hypothetical protein
MIDVGLAAPTAMRTEAAPSWLSIGVPLTLLLDLACLPEPGYPAILGQALAREGLSDAPAPDL